MPYIIGAVFLAIIIIIAFFRIYFKDKGKRKEADLLINDEWTGLTISMPGLQAPVSSRFDDDLKLIFKSMGRCRIEMGNKILKGKWKIKKSTLYIKGNGYKTNTSLSRGFLTDDNRSIYMHDFENFGIDFSSKKYLDALPAKIEKRKQQEEEELNQWLMSLDYDLSTCNHGFKQFLKSVSFEKFQPIEITGENRDEILNDYFQPVLSLGLQHTTWSYSYRLDGDRLLDGYETYEFNKNLTQVERAEKDGLVMVVPFDEIESFITPRLKITNSSDGTTLPEPFLPKILRESSRYATNQNGFEMKVRKDIEDFKVSLLEAWHENSFRKRVLIHVLYGDGNNIQDHAWFLSEKSSATDLYFYIGGSASESAK